jgi:alkylation response protein AidB-like acyl-CoA dehydrogenase
MYAPNAFGCQAPDSGNSEILALAGTPEQKDRYLKPLAAADVRSCFAMTERDVASSDPRQLRTRAEQDRGDWVIDGEKWFVSGAAGAAFAVVVAMTDPDEEKRHRRHSLFVVNEDNPGWHVVREIPVMGSHGPGGHCEVRLEACRVPADAMLGGRGEGFALSQRRLGMGRIGHAMRWIGVAQRALDLAAARALQRKAFGKRLAEHEAVAFDMADSAIELYASRLMVLHAAWLIETGRPYRQEVSIAKVYISESLNKIVDRALQVFGSLGYSTDTPIEAFFRAARAARIYDGASEVHRMVIARTLLKAAMTEGTTKGATGGLA